LRTPETLCLTWDLLTLSRCCCTYTSTTLGSSRLESFVGSSSLLTSGILLSDTEEIVSVWALIGLSGYFGITESTSDTGGSEGRLVIVARGRVRLGVGGSTVRRLSLRWLCLGDWRSLSRWCGLVVEVSSNGVVSLESRLGGVAI
jgi:hypothetical protein